MLVAPAVDYDGLDDAMFHLIRQNAAGSPPVLMRLLEVLTAVAGRERNPTRLATLARHADLIRADLHRRHARFVAIVEQGPAGVAGIGSQPTLPVI